MAVILLVPPALEVLVDLSRSRFVVEALAEAAEGPGRDGPAVFDDAVVRLPPEEVVVEAIIRVDGTEQFGQFPRSHLRGVHVGSWRSEGTVVGPSENDWDDPSVQQLEKLLRDVVSAECVLEGEVELVVTFHHVVAPILIPCPASEVPAGPVDVHLDVFREALHVLFPHGIGLAVGDEPGDQFGLSLSVVDWDVRC